MTVVHDRIRYMIEDVSVKIQQLEEGEVMLPLKGHSEWLQSIQRDTNGRMDPQLLSLIQIYKARITAYNDLLKRTKTSLKDIIESRDKTVKALEAYGTFLRGKK